MHFTMAAKIGKLSVRLVANITAKRFGAAVNVAVLLKAAANTISSIF